MRKIITQILNFIFPRSCLGCGRLGGYICLECMASTDNQVFEQVCPVCSELVSGGGIHLECQQYTWFSGFHNLGLFRGILADGIWEAKYNFYFSILDELAKYFYLYLKQRKVLERTDYITFVPANRRRLFWRGFNQSYYLAKKLSDYSGVPLAICMSKKSDIKKSQVGLNRGLRRENIKGGFDLIGQPAIGRYLIVDDVYTTGATLSEVAKVLSSVEGVEVEVAVLARD